MLVPSRSARRALHLLFLVLFLPVFALPLLVIVAASFATSWSGALPSGPTLAHYQDLAPGEAPQALLTSVLTALAASLAALTAGTWAALAAEKLGGAPAASSTPSSCSPSPSPPWSSACPSWWPSPGPRSCSTAPRRS